MLCDLVQPVLQWSLKKFQCIGLDCCGVKGASGTTRGDRGAAIIQHSRHENYDDDDDDDDGHDVGDDHVGEEEEEGDEADNVTIINAWTMLWRILRIPQFIMNYMMAMAVVIIVHRNNWISKVIIIIML